MEMPICQQNVFSLLRHPSLYDGVLDFSLKNNMGFVGYSPLAQGLLTGKYQNGIDSDSRIDKAATLNYFKTADMLKENTARLNTFTKLVEEFELDFVSVALNWVKKQQVIPVFGASSVLQIDENLKSFSIEIPNEFWVRLEATDLVRQ
jgi:aryl-alcohol dehydrogenase-like predicted oxidoreductase